MKSFNQHAHIHFPERRRKGELFVLPVDKTEGQISTDTHLPMLKQIPNSDWLFCINSFRYSSTDHPGILREDKGFGADQLKNAISNNNRGASELALSIAMPLKGTLLDTAQHPNSHTSNSIRNYLDHLLQELSLLSQLIPQNRQVTYLHWQGDLSHLLTPAQMTELMCMLNKYFNLSTSPQRRFVIEYSDIPQNDDNIALLKGLGFNRVCLGTRSTEENKISELAIPVKMFRDYDFSAVNMRVLLKKELGCVQLRNQLQSLMSLKPDTVYLIDENEKQLVIEGQPINTHEGTVGCRSCLSELLTEAGYEQVNHVKYALTDREPSYKIKDIIGAGIGAISLIDNSFSQNHHQLDRYFSALEQNDLPIAMGGYISAT